MYIASPESQFVLARACGLYHRDIVKESVNIWSKGGRSCHAIHVSRSEENLNHSFTDCGILLADYYSYH